MKTANIYHYIYLPYIILNIIPGHVVVSDELRNLPVLVGVEHELCVDLIRGGRQHVQVVEGALVAEAAEVAVAHNFLVALLAVP